MTTNSLATEQATALMQRFYGLFNGDLCVLDDVVADGWRNNSSNGTYNEQAPFGAIIAGLRQAVPDLAWTIDEILIDNNRVTVRGHGVGTPTAAIFGVEPTGRSFSLLSIDIHTVDAASNRITSSFHLEDWAGALQQLQAGQ